MHKRAGGQMYKRVKNGLGWSEAPWSWEVATLGINCELETAWEKPRSVCFENNPEDQQVANVNQCVRYHSAPCETQGRDGEIWCCPENYPRDYMQTVPSDVSSYDEERRRLLAQEPETTTPGAPDASDQRDPRPVSRHTFWTRLTHPGAITAMVAIAGGGTLFYLMKRRREQR